MAAPAKRSRAPLLLRWLLLNIIRLFGIVAIGWAIGVQVRLLVADVRGANSQTLSASIDSQNHTNPLPGSSSSAASDNLPPFSSITDTIVDTETVNIPNAKFGTQSVPPTVLPQIPQPSSLDNGLSETRLIYASTTRPLAEVSQPTLPPQNLPQALYPESASILPTTLPSSSIINLRKRAVSPEIGLRVPKNESLVERYFPDSTVPNQSGGLLFAVLQRAFICLALLLLLPGQLGWPERFLIKHLHLLSMRSSGLALGIGKIWIGIDMQRHFVLSAYRLPSILLLCSGGLDVLIAAFLVFQQSQKNKGQLVATRDVYLRYHIAQRFLFWTNVPLEAFYGNDSFGSSQGPRVEDEENHLKRSRPYAPDYPTLTRGGLDNPESQIPDMNGEKASYICDQEMETIEEEIEDLSEEVIENTRLNARSSALFQGPLRPQLESKRIPPPQIPAEIAALPNSIQQMWRGVQPRFGAEQAMTIPTIQLQPSTPSTIASRSQSIKFSRPDTLFSTSSSGTSSTDSSAADRSKIISQSSQAFPIPPERAVVPQRSRPKSHLVNRKMDDTKLMPPKKSALRRHSQFAPAASERRSSILDLNQNSKASGGPGTPGQKEDASRRSFVRFDLHRMSACSTDTTSSVDSGLSDILPPKPPHYRKPNSEEPIETVMALPGTEVDDSSIYSGISQDIPRIDTMTSLVKERPSSNVASPSRLSYLLTNESSPESPFSDIHASKPDSTHVKNRRSVCPARTVSTVHISAEECTAKSAPIKLSARLPPSDPAIYANTKDETELVAKKKKRMSHLAV